MLSRASVPLVLLICALIVGGVSLFVNTAYNQDQVAADAAIRQGARTIMERLKGSTGALGEGNPLTEAQLNEFTAKFQSEQAKPFGARSPVRWREYEFIYAADRHLLIGRPKFYGRSYWLTVAVLHDPSTHQFHLYVNDAGGRWGVEPPNLELGPDWHEWKN